MTYFSDSIIKWHLKHGRKNLPWQGAQNPYAIWVSEIMLQQTQVTTVIPYYHRFMQRFPDIESLATANIDDVLHLWTGLGYYARGRNLHKAAQQIMDNHQGTFPTHIDDVMALRGIGRSTAGAILSFAFSQRQPILDGNVKRVLSRFFGVDGWYGKRTVAEKLWDLADQHTPEQEVAVYTQAIMDFGATLCTRSKPHCAVCPIEHDCVARQENRIDELPGKKPKKAIPTKSCLMLIIQDNNNHILLLQRPPSGIWGGLWVPPQIDKILPDKTIIIEHVKHEFGIELTELENGDAFRHTFSHYHLDIQPVFASLSDTSITSSSINDDNSLWIDLQQPLQIGLPAPIKKLLESIHHNTHPRQRELL